MSREDTIKLTVKSLLEVVQTGAKNIEISVMERYGVITVGLMYLPYSCRRLWTSCRALIWHRSRPSLRKLSVRRKLVGSTGSCVIIALTNFAEAERKRSRLAATAAGQAAMSQAAGGSGQ